MAALVVGAPQAAADPDDLVPYCSGDQTPMDSNCRPAPSQTYTHPPSGLDPNLPYGVNPGQEPAI
jgi:hypothetical protein